MTSDEETLLTVRALGIAPPPPNAFTFTIAMLERDGRVERICTDCGEHLENIGMFRIRFWQPIERREPAFRITAIVYVIAPPYTFEDCQKAARERHDINMEPFG